VFLKKIRDIKEGVPFQSEINESGLHARKHAGDPALVNAASEGVFLRALEVNLDKLIVFEHGHAGLVQVRRDY